MFFPHPVPLYSQEGTVTLEKGVGGVEQHVWEALMWSVGVSDSVSLGRGRERGRGRGACSHHVFLAHVQCMTAPC